MNTEQREEIERALRCIDEDPYAMGSTDSSWAVRTVMDFARQQLNLRVDGEKLKRLLQDEVHRRQKMDIIVDGQKLMESIINTNLVRPQCAMDENHPIINVWEANAEEQLEALVLECLTTTPEEKE